MKILLNFKKTFFWKIIVSFLLNPIINFIWLYIINAQGTLYKFFWFLKKRDYIDLNNNDKILVNNFNKFLDLAKLINDQCNIALIEKIKKRIINSNSVRSLNYDYNQTNAGDNSYTSDFFNDLPENVKKKIIEFSMSDLMISTAAKYLGTFPILAKVVLGLNIPRKKEHIRGAMLWHKDDFGFKSLDLFLAINDVNDLNGPLSAMKEKDLGVLSRIDEEIKNPIRGERGKIRNNTLDINEKDLVTLRGPSGTALLIDSFTAYHKGGHCLENHRIMLRFSYQTVDSIRLPNNPDNKFYYYPLISKNNISNIYLKFLFFKRSFVIKKFKLSTLFLRIYRILHYKYNFTK